VAFNVSVARPRSTLVDPTKTTQLRRRFEADFIRRFRKIIKHIKNEIIELDGFDLNGVTTNRRFDFPTDQAKVAGFMSWLQTEVDAEIFNGTLVSPRFVAAQNSWMNTYIQTAYRRGMATSLAEVRKAGGKATATYVQDAFLRPVHADRAGIIYSRAYEGLANITTEMSKQVSEVLGQGLLNGSNPEVLARQIVNRVEKISITRARMLARTEAIAAHAEAKLNVYEDANIQGVGLMSELLTAGDDLVCEECDAASAAGPYEVAAAHGLIPLHPNCRCTWIPVITSGKEITLS